MTTPTTGFLAAMAAGCALAAPVAAQQRAAASITVRAENTLAFERRDETIALSWATVQGRLSSATPARIRVLDAMTRAEIASQAVDNDGDGRTDELLFQASFFPGEAKSFVLEAAPPATHKPRVHIRHDAPRDDMAWESDRIAFRIYGEGLKKTPSAMSSNGIDVWVKSVHALILEKWYTKGHDAYHVDTGEGADFYDVGQTLGTGGTAIWRDDAIHRADNFKAWKIVANGPIRAIFELRYDPWDAAGLRVSETKRIAIDAGQNLYRQESVFSLEGGAAATEIPYAIGVVKRPGMVGTQSKAHPWAWLTGWGPVARKNGGHGDLGNAILLPRDRVVDWKEAGDHYLAISRARPGERVVHYIGAGWTDSGDFRDVSDWWSYLDRFAQRLATPIRVTIGS